MAGQAVSNRQDDHRPPLIAANIPCDGRFGAFAVADGAGQARTVLSVGGVRCAGCIRKIEAALMADPAVTHARLNFSTMRLSLSWQGAPIFADTLASRVAALGYAVAPYDAGDNEAGSDRRESRHLLTCMGVAGFAAGNIMLLSFALWTTTGEIMGVAMRDFLHWIAGLIAIPAVAYSGRPFFVSAFNALRGGRANMDVPISIALILTVSISVFETFNHGEHVYFDSAVMLMFFLLIGRYLDFRSRQSARAGAGDLLAAMAGTATVVEDAKHRIIPIRDLRPGMIAFVAMGEKIPADGVIISGTSEIDTGLVTGESMPHAVSEGDSLHSGTINMASPLTIRIVRPADESLLADVVRLMEKAEQGQARFVRIADRAARLYTPVVHTLAAAAFIGWVFFGGMDWQPALMIAVTVLIITCPCALGLAVPVVQVLAIGGLLRRGVLVKSGDALERLASVDCVIFDKTGTLTHGRPALLDPEEYAPEDLALAAALASRSRHPLARALAAAWKGAIVSAEVTEHPGKGLEAMHEGRLIRLGSRVWCGNANAPLRDDVLELWLSVAGRAPLAFLFADPLRPDAAAVIENLRARGLMIHLLSGDRPKAVTAMAARLGIDHAAGGMSPGDKFAFLQDLRAQGHKVLMVGDGLNDAPILAGADASASPANAIDMAQNAADIVFMGDRMAPIVDVVGVAHRVQRLVRQNFFLAAAYNLVAIPVALAGGVTPLVAAIAMSASSLLVIANSFRLRFLFKPVAGEVA